MKILKRIRDKWAQMSRCVSSAGHFDSNDNQMKPFSYMYPLTVSVVFISRPNAFQFIISSSQAYLGLSDCLSLSVSLFVYVFVFG